MMEAEMGGELQARVAPRLPATSGSQERKGRIYPAPRAETGPAYTLVSDC